MKIREVQASFLALPLTFDKIHLLFLISYFSLMKKIFLTLVMLSLLTSCSSTPTDSIPSITDTTVNTQNIEVQNGTYEKDLKEVSGKIKSSDEFKDCMDMNVPMCIQTAGMQLAQKERSTEFCSELPTPEQKESCVFAITMINAQEKDDMTLCDTLTASYATQCTMSFIKNKALAEKDPKICESIPLSVEENPSDTSRDDCMLNVFMISDTTTSASCDIIQDTQVKEMCSRMLSTRPEIQ